MKADTFLIKIQDDENLQGQELSEVCKHYKKLIWIFRLKESRDKLEIILLYGSKRKNLRLIKTISSSGRIYDVKTPYEGALSQILKDVMVKQLLEWIREWIESYMTESSCPKCQGKRLNEAALSVKRN